MKGELISLGLSVGCNLNSGLGWYQVLFGFKLNLGWFYLFWAA